MRMLVRGLGGTQTFSACLLAPLSSSSEACSLQSPSTPPLPTPHHLPHTCSAGACHGTSTGWTLRWMWRAPSTSSTPATSSTSTASRPTSCSGLLVCAYQRRGRKGLGLRNKCAGCWLVCAWARGVATSPGLQSPFSLQHHQPSKAGRRRLGPGAGRAAVPEGLDVPVVACTVGSACAVACVISLLLQPPSTPLPTLLLPCADPVPLVHHWRRRHLQLGGACLLRGTGRAGTAYRRLKLCSFQSASSPVHARQLLSGTTPFSRSNPNLSQPTLPCFPPTGAGTADWPQVHGQGRRLLVRPG